MGRLGRSCTAALWLGNGGRRAALLIVLATMLSGCKLLYLPPVSWVVMPVGQFSDSSTHAPGTSTLVGGREDVLKRLTVAVLRNSHRDTWSSKVGGDVVDEHADENTMLADYLAESGLFGSVILIDRLESRGQDFTITCSIECMYNIDLDGAIWLLNVATLGVGFLVGWPHQDSSAFYVAESIVYDHRGESPVVVTGAIAENYKEWYCDNIYWRPDFYGAAALAPVFEHILFDFLSRSGCLAE